MKIGIIDTHAAEGEGSGNRTYICGLVRALARLPDDWFRREKAGP